MPFCIFIFVCFLAYFWLKWSVFLKKKSPSQPWIVYFAVSLIVIFSLHSKNILCFLHWILHSFLYLKPLAIFCKYYLLELENIHFIFMGMFWFVLDLECAWVIHVVLSLSLLGVIFVSFCMLSFSVLGRRDWFFISLSLPKRSFSFLSPFLYS